MTRLLANRYISVIYRYGKRFFTHALKKRKLPADAGDLPFLLQAYRNPGITQDGIAQALGMDKGTTARCLSKMERTGLIYREIDARDRRVNHIYPTDAAAGFQSDMFEIVDELHAILYQGFDEEEIKTAIALLTRMKDNIAGHIDRIKSV